MELSNERHNPNKHRGVCWGGRLDCWCWSYKGSSCENLMANGVALDPRYTHSRNKHPITLKVIDLEKYACMPIYLCIFSFDLRFLDLSLCLNSMYFHILKHSRLLVWPGFPSGNPTHLLCYECKFINPKSRKFYFRRKENTDIFLY